MGPPQTTKREKEAKLGIVNFDSSRAKSFFSYYFGLTSGVISSTRHVAVGGLTSLGEVDFYGAVALKDGGVRSMRVILLRREKENDEPQFRTRLQLGWLR